MPTDLNQASTGSQNLVFASDMNGVVFRITETAVYDAEEVREALDQPEDGTPEYGRWFPAEIEGQESFLNAPGEFIEELQRIDPETGEIVAVTRAEKAGRGETDPWEINLETRSDDAQTRL